MAHLPDRSIFAGPFHFLFCRDGERVAVESGIRLGQGPRGYHVSARNDGFRYRSSAAHAGAARVLPLEEAEFGDLLAGMNDRQARISLSRLFGRALAVLGLSVPLLAGPHALVLLLLALPGWAIGRWLDSWRRTAVVFYDLEEPLLQAYRAMIERFDALGDCRGKWQIAPGDPPEIRRRPVLLDRALPEVLRSNVVPPVFHLSGKRVYLLPDAVLVESGKRIASLGYGELRLARYSATVTEEGALPGDGESAGAGRWRYDVMHLSGTGALDELIEFSRTGLVRAFFGALDDLSRHRVTQGVPA